MEINNENSKQTEMDLCSSLYKTIEALTLMKYDDATQATYFQYLQNNPAGLASGKMTQAQKECDQMLEELKQNGYTTSKTFHKTLYPDLLLGELIRRLENNYMPDAFNYLNKNFYSLVDQATNMNLKLSIQISKDIESGILKDLPSSSEIKGAMIQREIHSAYSAALFPTTIGHFNKLKTAYNQNMAKETGNELNTPAKAM